MKDADDRLVSDAYEEIFGPDERLEVIISREYSKHLSSIPEEKRREENSRIVTRLAYLIISNCPDFDELIKGAATTSEKERLERSRIDYLAWLFDDRHREEKDQAIWMIFEELTQNEGLPDMSVEDFLTQAADNPHFQTGLPRPEARHPDVRKKTNNRTLPNNSNNSGRGDKKQPQR